MKKDKKKRTVVFTGGGTGGHIYPGLGVADELRKQLKEKKIDGFSAECEIVWIGSLKGVDKDIVEKSGSVDRFVGIPCGKLRRYFSIENLIDFFKIIGGFISAFFVLLKIKPIFVFSKGGFVSVPSCYAAKVLKIPVYTHECDYSPGLATKLNSKTAKNIFLSFENTSKFFPANMKSKLVVTGNPVRPIFYSANKEYGLEFIKKNNPTAIIDKPILLVLGGSLGAKQINQLVKDNLEWLSKRFYVVHQTGSQWAEELLPFASESYSPIPFIYSEMPAVMATADVVLSRAGSNFLWECAVTGKPLVLVPLSGSGTRGDQVENAAFFEEKNAAIVLGGKKADGTSTLEATNENLQNTLEIMLDSEKRKFYSNNVLSLTTGRKPAEYIGSILCKEVINAL